ncbi:MAG: efflux RND transporter permease subunit, partial [Vicingaceae bacterium]
MENNKTENKKGLLKDFGLTNASLNNKTTVFVLLFIITLGGLVSYLSMPRESFPEVVIPQIYVGTAYPGNSPLDVEKLISRPLEKEINTITGIDKLTSTSVQGFSTILVEFDFDVTPEEALRKVKDKVDIAMSDGDFPTDLPADPNIFEMNLSEMTPIMNINLSGDFSIDQLEDYAEYLEDEIEALPEITEVDIRGVQKKEMKIMVDLYKMQNNEISLGDIAMAINNENATISAGDILSDNYRRTVRIVGEYKNAEEIENTIIKNEKFNVVYLRDIAEVSFEDKEKESYAREYTKPVVMVDVKKRAGENLINASDKITAILDHAKAHVFPRNLEISITNDQSDQTRMQVSELENSIIFGMLLVIGVLLFFLGIRNALFVGIAIPLSMFIAFLILGAMGVTLNMMVLFSLVLALGMLVDNGIVVVENIYRLMDEGMSGYDAAKHGVGEVAWPIIASTATTLAAFIPLAIWPGIMGEFMKFLPITLIVVLSSSLFVALVINPVLTSVFMKVEEINTPRKKVFRIVGILIGSGLLITLLGVIWLGNLLIISGLIGLLNKFVLTPTTL